MYRIAILLAFTTVSGCTMRGNDSKTTAWIDDGRTSGGFEIAEVDGKPPTRWHNPVATAVPFVLVEPGSHEFAIDEPNQTFMANVEQGKKYRTEMRNGTPSLVEIPRSAESSQLAD